MSVGNTYTIDGWRDDSYAVAGVDDETRELVTIAVSAQEHRILIDFLRAAASAGWPYPKITADDSKILTRRHKTLGDYGYNND